MSGGYRNDRPALIVLGLLVASLVLVSLIGLYARHEANYQVGCYTAAKIDQNGVEQNSTICPDDFLYFGDGLAQWIMTTFAIVATVVSLVGIVLLRRTFEETKRTADAAEKSNRTARKIGEAQVRAYVSCTSCEILGVAAGSAPRAELNITNYGQSPAVNIRFQARIDIEPWPERNNKVLFAWEDISTIGLGNAQTHGQSAQMKRDMTDAEFIDCQQGAKAVFVYTLIKSTDVFNRESQVRQRFVLTPDDFVDGKRDAAPAKNGHEYKWGYAKA